MRIEVLFFQGCPHSRPAVEQARRMVAELGVEAEVCEVEVRDAEGAVCLRFPGSPTVRVDGIDVEPGADAGRVYGLSCRMYGGSGVPPRDLLVSAIRSAAAAIPPPRARALAAVGVPVAGLSALPACPACYPLYAGGLSALGLTAFASPGGQAGLTAVLLAVALAALAYRARTRRGYGPLALGIGASLIVLAGKFLVGFDPLSYAGTAGLVAASLWNAWPAGRRAACEACGAGEVAR